MNKQENMILTRMTTAENHR